MIHDSAKWNHVEEIKARCYVMMFAKKMGLYMALIKSRRTVPLYFGPHQYTVN